MKWTAEQDVLCVLLHSMGRIPSLDKGLRLPPSQVPVERLRKRAVQLGLASEGADGLQIEPGLRDLLAAAGDVSDIVEVLLQPEAASDKPDRYYYLGNKETVVVEKAATQLVLRQCDPEGPLAEVLAMLGAAHNPVATLPLRVPIPVAQANPPDFHTQQWAQLSALMGGADLWFIVRVSRGEVRGARLVVAGDGQCWTLQQPDEQTVMLAPTTTDGLRSELNGLFAVDQGD